MESAVHFTSAKASATLTHQMKTLSNKKAITVFPPARSVKYAVFNSACCGRNRAEIMISRTARYFTSSVVL